MSLPLDNLDLLAAPELGQPGAPLQLPVESIDEDPDQPRQDFDPGALQELAESIALRGVLQAISVRPHPQQSQRWMVNFGARRLRASRMAGKPVIPAYVDPGADSYDQVIENEQRESLKPLELALFVQKQMRTGISPGEIAKRLGKSRGYLTFIGSLIDAPDWLLALYRSGRCRGITELYELRKLHDAQPETVERWLVDQPHVSRADLLAFKERLTLVEPSQPATPPDIRLSTIVQAHTPGGNAVATAADGGSAQPSPSMAVRIPADRVIARHHELALFGDVDGGTVRVLLDTTGLEEGRVFVVNASESPRVAVSIASIERLRLEVVFFERDIHSHSLDRVAVVNGVF